MPAPSSPAAATAAYAARHAARCAPGHWRTLAGRTVSSIGLGTYLGKCDPEEDDRYEAAALACLAGGVNLLDTAINYRCPPRDRALRRALPLPPKQGIVVRDQVLVCTQAGSVPFGCATPR